ncbi:MAG: type II toxin-antitoxin system prevent-host-death family antitoxin [Xanthomonadales bacterium]|nr:type II toxin-antitoxin system prevent-host-death family antitoxin [Xanthomonadales bacterium]
MNEPQFHDFQDVSATEFKQRFGKLLESAAHGQPVRIIRHGRRDESLVLVREDALAALTDAGHSPLEALRAEFDALVAHMQTPKARKAAASLGDATVEELGQAALDGFKRSKRSGD